jgi:hypothetical protein
MIQFSRNGVKMEWSWPNWLKQMIMRWQGYCGNEHSMHRGYYCVHKRDHSGWCGCA